MDDSCFICGVSNQVVLQQHHIVPRQYGGSDIEENLVTLCANCHQAVEKIYDKDFYRRLGVEEADLSITEVPVDDVDGLLEFDYCYWVSKECYLRIDEVSVDIKMKSIPEKERLNLMHEIVDEWVKEEEMVGLVFEGRPEYAISKAISGAIDHRRL